MLTRVSLPRFITLPKNSSPGFWAQAGVWWWLRAWCSSVSMCLSHIQSNCGKLVYFYREHPFYFTTLHQLPCISTPARWIDSIHPALTFTYLCFLSFCWKRPAVTLFCWFCCSAKPHIPFFPNTLNVFSGEGKECVTQLSITPPECREQRQIIHPAVGKTDRHVPFCTFTSSFSPILPLWLFVLDRRYRQNNQWGVKSSTHYG